MSRYDAEQKQRLMERQIRKERSKLARLDTAIKASDNDELKISLKNDFDNLSVKLKFHEAKYKDFSYKTGLPPQKQRLQMYGFNRSVSQKAVHANFRAIEKEESKTKYLHPDTVVNKKAIRSAAYRRRIDKISNNTDVNRAIWNKAQEILIHRSGTKFEDLAFIDSETGKSLINTSFDKENFARPNKRMEEMLKMQSLIQLSVCIIILEAVFRVFLTSKRVLTENTNTELLFVTMAQYINILLTLIFLTSQWLHLPLTD